ncbi:MULTISPECIES: sensor histidine kinase [Colwellia]|uniref:histidine kinase n=1 Tax=Colwellia psychrerythraea (strain 34H / ATCC BAA-681) TaxID=167879 RepID=Q47Z21_COLP3|nr:MULTISPECIES: ATP-binding protein [Colwellia]AAZ28347.1 sensor histidine kinase [Colwellia psychrerythraea 34H]PKH87065.1 two-component sensor histidine kinase [Colwellia sp. Bg11-28]
MIKTTVSFALARFVFISCVGLAVIITSLVSTHVVDLVNSEYEKIAKGEITALNSSYRVFLNHHLILLKEQSQESLFVQGIMQPKRNIGKIKDYMAGLTLLGLKYDETLLDFEGSTLHSTSATDTNYQEFPWVKAILNEEQFSSIQILAVEGRYFWCVAFPVIYNKHVEGVLLANIPLETILAAQIDVEVLDGLMIEVVKGTKTIAKFGKQAVGTKQTIQWHDAGVSFNYTVDEAYRNDALYDLVIQMGSYIILAIVLTTLLAYLYGYRYFVKPILALSQLTSSLDKGHEPDALQGDLRFMEFADLFNQFNLMSEKVARRERALKESYEKLSNTNDELKQSESQLVQSEKMASIGVLAAGVAHEINNPIGFIRSNLEVLEDYFSDVEKYYYEFNSTLASEEDKENHKKLAKKYELEFLFKDTPPLIKSSIAGVDRVSEIVKNLKTFARIDQVEKALVDINEGLNATLNMVHNELKYSCKVHIDLQPLPKVHAFPGKLNQVFMNLLINAGQSITDKGDIFVRTFVEEDNIIIEIEDTGSGIDSENITQIFTPFYTSKPIGEGTGLGLSISHQIIEQHNGKIRVKSVLGKGSCFSVSIPIS